MATRLLHGMKFFEQLWKPFTQGSILPSLVEIGLVVFHKKIFQVHYIIFITHTNKHTGESLYATASQMLRWHKKIPAKMKCQVLQFFMQSVAFCEK
jgi:hypothetical protein